MDASGRVVGLGRVRSGYILHACQTSKRNVSELPYKFESALYYLRGAILLIDYNRY